MDIRRITEVGVAVRDLDGATDLLVNLFEAQASEACVIEEYSMRFRMCRLGKIDFELMEPLGDTGVIADFLKSHGEGLHHIAFAVDDVVDTMDTLTSKGVSFVDDVPISKALDVVDFAGRRFSDELSFTFSHPKSILGVLIEFIQYPDGYQAP